MFDIHPGHRSGPGNTLVIYRHADKT